MPDGCIFLSPIMVELKEANVSLETIRLTETVAKGGCAAKLPAGQLREFLSVLKLPKDPSLLVGTETLDDACLWDLGNGTLLIKTLDFFTPIVDDPKDFGRIAAANALSDVYAMGGDPKIALTILAFPSSKLPFELILPLMEGAVEKIAEAGAVLGGGHSIDDDTLKLGFSVTGFVDKARAWTNAAAKAGDCLLLTKGLGTGTITSALKNGKASPLWVEAAVRSMCRLNDAKKYLRGISVHAATDITGFGLAGHALQMAQASKKCFQINLSRLPTISGARESLDLKILNRAHRTNLDYVKSHVRYDSTDETGQWLSVDPQTSGGLLLAIPREEARKALQSLSEAFPMTCIIGQVEEHEPGQPWVVFV